MERRLTGMIAAAAVLLILFVMWDMFRPAPRVQPSEPDVISEPDVPPTSSSQGTAAGAGAAPTPAATGREPTYNDLLARSETRRRIRASTGTYLNEMLAASYDSMLRRWDDRGIRSPVHVWFAPTYAANFQPAFVDAIRQAFGSWNAVVPVQFDLNGDSTNAEVVFRWKPQFEIERTGQTDLRWDQDGRIRTATVTLSTFDPKGRAMDVDDIRVVALHEIGHLLGLDHSPDSTDLMFPTAKVRELSERDVRTIQLLYQLPSGSVR